MSTSNQFLLTLQANQDIQAQLHRSRHPHLEISTPSTPVARVKLPVNLPSGSVLLGLTEAGQTLSLDLYDPAPGPLLVAGEGGSGKTALLRSLAYFSGLQDPGDIQFGVVTYYPEEWARLETYPHSLGVWPAYHPSAQAFLSRLVNWAEGLSKTRQAILLLFDGLDLLTGSDIQLQHALRWLLLNGPVGQVWPVVTINATRMAQCSGWLELFQTRLIGRVKQPQNSPSLLADPHEDLSSLLPGTQFLFSRPDNILKFWLPPLVQA